MRELHYQRVSDIDEAIAAVSASPDAWFIAGGTNLFDLMKAGDRESRMSWISAGSRSRRSGQIP
jgi:CO/xanthine dehydrogenase FAD-binding subunit